MNFFGFDFGLVVHSFFNNPNDCYLFMAIYSKTKNNNILYLQKYKSLLFQACHVRHKKKLKVFSPSRCLFYFILNVVFGLIYVLKLKLKSFFKQYFQGLEHAIVGTYLSVLKPKQDLTQNPRLKVAKELAKVFMYWFRFIKKLFKFRLFLRMSWNIEIGSYWIMILRNFICVIFGVYWIMILKFLYIFLIIQVRYYKFLYILFFFR